MKLVTFIADGETRLGALLGERVIDLNAAARLDPAGPPAVASSLKALLELGDEGLAAARRALAAAEGESAVALAGVAFAREAVRLLAPVPDPQKILCIGQNYRDHCAEQGKPLPERVAVFGKWPTCVIGDGDAIELPSASQAVDYEAELAVVIGRRGKDIPPAAAYDHVAGYTCLHDVSARDVQYADGGGQWLRGKSFDTFCPLGPCLVTRDEIPDPHTLDIWCELNGRRMQQSNTENLVFRVDYLVSELSRGVTLLPGDIITTGTPGGVGWFREPRVLLQPGDQVTIGIAGIGELRNPVA